MKALNILSTVKSVKDRAQSYSETISRELKRTVLDPLIIKKERLEDEIASLEDFSLQTDHNKGQAQMSREDCQKRFTQIIETKWELCLVQKELEEKTKYFNEYFDNESSKSEE